MDEEKQDIESVKLLWTGGWDSTFQLLRLLFIERRPVDPYYLIDEQRSSTGMELLTMKRILGEVRKMDKQAAELVHPIKYFSASQIPEDFRITRAYESVRSSSFIGSQYDWLARFCEHQGITGLHLCIHEDDKAALVVAPLTSKSESNGCFQMATDQALKSEVILFKYFYFPILDLTKMKMESIAQAHGWSHIMEMTWFCHSPRNGKPCGRCSPCRYTIEEGMGRRIPVARRWIGRAHRLIQQIKKHLKRLLVGLRVHTPEKA